MKTKLMTIAPLAGLAISANAQVADVSVTASRTTIAIGERVKWTVTISSDLAGGTPFGWHLHSAYIHILAQGNVDGTVSGMEFQHYKFDHGATDEPFSLISDSQPVGRDLMSTHWRINDLTGDLDDFFGTTYQSPYVLGSFYFTPTTEGDSLSFDVVEDRDFLDTQFSVDDPIVWSEGPGLLFAYHGITTSSDTVRAVVPGASTSVILVIGAGMLARRRRFST